MKDKGPGPVPAPHTVDLPHWKELSVALVCNEFGVHWWTMAFSDLYSWKLFSWTTSRPPKQRQKQTIPGLMMKQSNLNLQDVKLALSSPEVEGTDVQQIQLINFGLFGESLLEWTPDRPETFAYIFWLSQTSGSCRRKSAFLSAVPGKGDRWPVNLGNNWH